MVPTCRAKALRFILPALAAGLCFGLPPTLRAAPAEELLRLVPPDPNFCLVVRDLRGHSARLADSPFLAQLKTSFLGKGLLQAPEAARLAELDKVLRAQLKVTLQEVRDDILGDALVVAAWSPGRSAAERTLLLTKARNPELLSRLAERVTALQLEAGELEKVEAVKYEGLEYKRCTSRAGRVNFLLVHEGVLALSEDEPTLRWVVAALARPPAVSPVAEHLRALGVDDAFLVLWINPRAFDAEMHAQAKSAPEPEATALRHFLTYWKSTQSLALALRLERDIELSVSLRADVAGLPPAARQFLARAAEPSAMWGRFPEKTILALTSRFDLAALLDLVTGFLTEAERQRIHADLAHSAQTLLGLDLRREVLPHLGPEWGFYVAAPPAGQGWFPHVVLAVEVQAKPERRPLNQALFEAIRLLVGIAAFSQKEAGLITLKTEQQGDVEVVSLASPKLFPPGLQPAVALKSSCLVFASSPAAVRAFGAPRAAPPPAAAGVPLARLSAREALAYLNDPARRQALVAALAANHGVAPAQVSAQLDNLTSVLGLFDEIELVQHTTANRLTLKLHLRPVHPLQRPAAK